MILFVCTGNTCRSPMAAYLARRQGVNAQAAGLCAQPGSVISGGALRALAAFGIDASGYRSRQVTRAMAEEADQIYAMSQRHAQALRQLYPDLAEKIHALSPAIPDPYMQSDEVYLSCADALLAAMKNAGILPPGA